MRKRQRRNPAANPEFAGGIGLGVGLLVGLGVGALGAGALWLAFRRISVPQLPPDTGAMPAAVPPAGCTATPQRSFAIADFGTSQFLDSGPAPIENRRTMPAGTALRVLSVYVRTGFVPGQNSHGPRLEFVPKDDQGRVAYTVALPGEEQTPAHVAWLVPEDFNSACRAWAEHLAASLLLRLPGPV